MFWLVCPVACIASEPPTAPALPPPTIEVTPAPDPVAEPAPEPTPLPPAEPLGLWLYDQAGDTREDLWGETDPELGAMVTELLQTTPMLDAALIDLHDPHDLRYTLIQPEWEIFTASLSKIAVLLGVMHKVHEGGDPGAFDEVRENANQMIKASSNEDAKFLFGWAGFDSLRDAIYAHQLYDDETGGLWWTPNTKYPSSPKNELKICGTARQIARYLLMMEQGRLIDARSSQTIKDVLHNSALAIFYKGTRNAEKNAKYYGKPGILGGSVSEGMLIEGQNTRYILVVLTEGTDYKNPGFGIFGERLHLEMMARHPHAEP